MGNCYSPRSRVTQLTVASTHVSQTPAQIERSRTQPHLLQKRNGGQDYSTNQGGSRNGDLRREHTFHERRSRKDDDVSIRKRQLSADVERRENSQKRNRSTSGSRSKVAPESSDSGVENLGYEQAVLQDLSDTEMHETGVLSNVTPSRATSQFSIANTSKVQIENMSEVTENGFRSDLDTPTNENMPVPRMSSLKRNERSRESARHIPSPIHENDGRKRRQATVTINERTNEKVITPTPRSKEGKTSPSTIALDIGTSFSGYAYGYKSRYSISVPQKKVPSVLLLNPDFSLHSYGFKALKNYPLVPGDIRKDYYYLENFKSVFFNTDRVRIGMTVKDNLGRDVNALLVVTRALEWLISAATENINYDENSTEWVLTIPSVWTVDLRRFMRRAALTCGLLDNKLNIYLEAEAASYFCRNEYSNLHDYDLSPGTKFAFADLGGGTTNVFVHEILRGNRLRELYRDTQHTYAGKTVNDAYVRFWIDLVGDEIWQEFRLHHPMSYMKMMITFEKKKMAFSVGKGERVDLLIETTLDQLLKVKKWASFDKLMKSKPKYKGNVKCKEINGNWYMFLSVEMMASFFADSVTMVVKRLMEGLAVCEDYDIKGIVLTGGYAKSPYLMEIIEESLDEYDVQILVPEATENAVVKGAIMMSQKPFEIVERRPRYTYGYSQAVPNPQNIAALLENKSCPLLFRTIIEKGQSMKNDSNHVIKGQEVVSNPNKMFAERTTRMVKSTCTKTKGSERYGMREEECEVICEFVHTPSHEGWPIRSEYELYAVCKETELKFVYVNKITGERMKTYVPFV